MNKRIAFVVLVLLIALCLAGPAAIDDPLWAADVYQSVDSADSNILFLPIVLKPPVLRVDFALMYGGRYEEWVVGKVTNLSNKTVYDLVLTASLYLDNELVEVITGTTFLPATFPSDSNLFELFPTGDSPYDPYFTIDVKGWSFEHDPEYLPLTVLSKNFSGGGDIGFVTGEIRNDNSVPVHGIEMMVRPGTEFVSSANPDKPSLAPGEITAYKCVLYYPGYPSGEGFTVWAQGAIVKQIP